MTADDVRNIFFLMAAGTILALVIARASLIDGWVNRVVVTWQWALSNMMGV